MSYSDFDEEMKIIYYEYMKNIKKTDTPVMLIKYGPPASGKGRKECTDKFFFHSAKYGFDPQNYVDINVDDIVTKLDKDKEIKKDSMQYFKFRPRANQIADLLLETSFKLRYNIVFETTGSRLDEGWLVKYLIEPASRSGYKIVVAYPLVPVPILIERSAKRALEIGRNPDPEQIKKDAVNAAGNLKILHKYVDLIILFDNRALTPCEFEIIECKNKICKLDLKWAKNNTNLNETIRDKFNLNISLEGGENPHNIWNNKRSNKHKRCKMCYKCRRCVNCGRKINKRKKNN